MPVEKKYKAGSIVYFEGDKADNIFILKNGKIRLYKSYFKKGCH